MLLTMRYDFELCLIKRVWQKDFSWDDQNHSITKTEMSTLSRHKVDYFCMHISHIPSNMAHVS